MDMTQEMEMRACACGCGMGFKCIATSPQRYACAQCEANVTPGGYTAILARKKRAALKAIPENATGEVGTVELSKLLGVSYQTVVNWTKCGKITPTDPAARQKKYDLSIVRTQVQTHMGIEPADHGGDVASEIGKKLERESARVLPVAALEYETVDEAAVEETVTADPVRELYRVVKCVLKQMAADSREGGDESAELQYLRWYITLRFKRFAKAVA